MQIIDNLQIPDNEYLWEQIHNAEGVVAYAITSDRYRDEYYLNTVDKNGKLKRTKYSADEPTVLSERAKKKIGYEKQAGG